MALPILNGRGVTPRPFRIVKAKFSFLLNETGKCYLLDVLELTIAPLLKYDWTNDKFLQMTNKREF